MVYIYICVLYYNSPLSWHYCENMQLLYSLLIKTSLLFQELPVNQTPEVFGMHDNVDIAKELQETRQLFNSVLLTQSQKSSGGGGKKGDEALLEIAKDILSKVSRIVFVVVVAVIVCFFVVVVTLLTVVVHPSASLLLTMTISLQRQISLQFHFLSVVILLIVKTKS